MLRSCYSTSARFYQGDSTIDDIEWQWVGDAPFLPVPCVINSLNWVDRRGLTDDGDAGEVAGTSRPYSKGNHDITLDAMGYAGSAVDFLGLGSRPSSPPARNMYGNLIGCRDDTGVLDMSMSLYVTSIGGGLAPEPVVSFIARSQEYAFDVLAQAFQDGTGGLPWNVDLYYANPNGSGTNDNLTDFSLCSFPGYATVQLFLGIIDPSTLIFGQQLDKYLAWTMTDFPGPGDHAGVMGLVATDSFGIVVFYIELVALAYFLNPGDQFLPVLSFVVGADYD